MGRDGLPDEDVEQYLGFLRAQDASPNTVQAYARGLSAWIRTLEDGGHGVDDFPPQTFGQFLAFLRTGDLPSVARVGAAPTWLSPASVIARAAAVRAFYTWRAEALGLVGGYARLYSSVTGRARPSGYVPMMAGITDRSGRGRPSPTHRPRPGPRRRAPVLTPAQIHTILAGCAARSQPGPGDASMAGARDRLLFALLAETGLRLGEALSLRHRDVHVGCGDTPWLEVVPRQDHPHVRSKGGGGGRVLYVSDDFEAAYSQYLWSLVDNGIDVDVLDLDWHWVFVNIDREPRWAPLRPETVYSRIRQLKSRHPDLPPGWSPHWLRHTHATALLLSGCPAHVVMRRLGHADIQTTLDTYAWVTEDAEMRSLAQWQQFTAGWRGVNP